MTDLQVALPSIHRLEFPVGRTETGELLSADLDQLQHLLVSGVSGSGKSVFLDSMLLTLLTGSTPQQLRLLLCDTKILSFTWCRHVRNLLVPVCTDHTFISRALSWASDECQKRLSIMANSACRKISTYNDHAWESFCPELPQIIIVVDDIAEIFHTQPGAIASVSSILSAGRAAGIHLVAVTQTPSERNIKKLFSQFPGRMIFQPVSVSEFQFLTQQKPLPVPNAPGDAVFCCDVSCKAVHALKPKAVDYSQMPKDGLPEYEEEVLQKVETPVQQANSDPSAGTITDPLFSAAVEIVLREGPASTSLLQRRLKLGYSKAAALLDEMERRGIVGPFRGARPRNVLITAEEWARITQTLEENRGTKEPATAENPSEKSPSIWKRVKKVLYPLKP